jgi:hypothetical protein
VDDSEVIDAFLDQPSASVFGPSLHIERGTLKLDGWWAMAFRVSERTVILRDEEAPSETTALADVAAALDARGLRPVGSDLPAISLLTYTNLDLGYAPWVLWSTDLATGEGDLNAKATEETFLEGSSATAAPIGAVDTDHVRGARRVGGGPSRVVLAVGVGDEPTEVLRAGLEDCYLERRSLDELAPADAGSLLPTLVLVDATGPAGSAFVAQLGSGEATGVPLVAITDDGQMRPGADAVVDAHDPPAEWLPLLRELLR